MNRTLLLVIAAVTVGFGLGAVATRSSSVVPATVEAATVPLGGASATVVALGRIEAASEDVDVQAKRGGRLREVLVDEGDRVQRGQVLAVMDADEVVAAERSALARVAVAEAELARLVAGARDEERREARAAVDQAEAALRHAQREGERTTALVKEGIVSADALDRAERDLAMAQARAVELRERAAFVAAPARADERARAEAAVRLARAQLEEARVYVADSTIRSPLDGRVVRRHKQSGESVSPDQPTPILTLADAAPLRVRVEVDERDVARVAEGQAVYVTADAYGDTRFTGTVVRVGERLGRKRIRTDNPAERDDTKVLETLVALDADASLPLDLRVTAFISVAEP